MKTRKIARLDGAVVFEVTVPTLMDSTLRISKHDMLLKELGELGDKKVHGLAATLRSNILMYMTSTKDIEVNVEGADFEVLKQFWDMSQNGATPGEYTTFFLENVHSALYHEWEHAIDARAQLDLPETPIEQRHPSLLTEDELADPN